MKDITRILILAANPSDTTRLRLDEEIRAIDQVLLQAEFRDTFVIMQHWAVRVQELQAFLLRHKPNFVHFSGHGSTSNEIILENESGHSQPVSVWALSQLFSVLKDSVNCVVLNACYSEQQARAIAKNIKYVIGMSKAIGDSSAISFAKAFYQAIGYGKNVKTAFDLGCVQIHLQGLGEQDIPKLITSTAIQPITATPSAITQPRFSRKDREIAKALYVCFDRPAFKQSFEHESDIEALIKALDDTIAAINTGVKKTRDGIVFGTPVNGKAYFDSSELYDAYDKIVVILSKAKTLYSKAKESGYFFFRGRFGVAFHRDHSGEATWVAIRIDELRNEALKIANHVYEQMGMRLFPYIRTPEYYRKQAIPPPFAEDESGWLSTNRNSTSQE